MNTYIDYQAPRPTEYLFFVTNAETGKRLTDVSGFKSLGQAMISAVSIATIAFREDFVIEFYSRRYGYGVEQKKVATFSKSDLLEIRKEFRS